MICPICHVELDKDGRCPRCGEKQEQYQKKCQDYMEWFRRKGWEDEV